MGRDPSRYGGKTTATYDMMPLFGVVAGLALVLGFMAWGFITGFTDDGGPPRQVLPASPRRPRRDADVPIPEGCKYRERTS